MKFPLIIFLGGILLSCSPFAAASTQAVTASDYVAFLNTTAVSDPEHIYENAMETDPAVASILRSGVPGHYHYRVLAGRENLPITFVNQRAEIAYIEWVNRVLSTALSREISANSKGYDLKVDHPLSDKILKSNQNPFFIENNASSQLNMISPEAVETIEAGVSVGEIAEDALVVAAVLAGARAGAEVVGRAEAMQHDASAISQESGPHLRTSPSPNPSPSHNAAVPSSTAPFSPLSARAEGFRTMVKTASSSAGNDVDGEAKRSEPVQTFAQNRDVMTFNHSQEESPFLQIASRQEGKSQRLDYKDALTLFLKAKKASSDIIAADQEIEKAITAEQKNTDLGKTSNYREATESACDTLITRTKLAVAAWEELLKTANQALAATSMLDAREDLKTFWKTILERAETE
ncbi:MAG: hypothetical protein ACH346_08700 [Chthoniobacterales bacterium]